MLVERMSARVSMAIPAGALKAIGRLNIPLYRWSGGRVFGKLGGAPVLLLTTTGRKSGQQRTAPVVYVRDGERIAVIGSNAGNVRAPAWALNLVANPEAEIQVGRRRSAVRARIAEDDERTAWWRRMTAQYPGFDSYEDRTDRDIRLFVLEPRG
jgi:F420H(2)-dependent quinone reductase